MSKFCPNCGTKNPDEAVFCGDCGNSLPTIEEVHERSRHNEILNSNGNVTETIHSTLNKEKEHVEFDIGNDSTVQTPTKVDENNNALIACCLVFVILFIIAMIGSF